MPLPSSPLWPMELARGYSNRAEEQQQQQARRMPLHSSSLCPRRQAPWSGEEKGSGSALVDLEAGAATVEQEPGAAIAGEAGAALVEQEGPSNLMGEPWWSIAVHRFGHSISIRKQTCDF